MLWLCPHWPWGSLPVMPNVVLSLSLSLSLPSSSSLLPSTVSTAHHPTKEADSQIARKPVDEPHPGPQSVVDLASFTNPNFWVRISSGGVGVFHVKGWGPKVRYVPRNPGKPNFRAGYPGIFAGMSRGCPKSSRKGALCSIFVPIDQARKRHINIIFFVRLVLGRPRVCPGDFTGFVPGTNPVKTWGKPGFSHYSTQWKPDFTGFVPGTNPVCPWDNPGDEGRHRKFM